jgi:hypothetical protein
MIFKKGTIKPIGKMMIFPKQASNQSIVEQCCLDEILNISFGQNASTSLDGQDLIGKKKADKKVLRHINEN